MHRFDCRGKLRLLLDSVLFCCVVCMLQVLYAELVPRLGNALRCLVEWSKQTLRNIKAMAADNGAAITAEQGGVLKGRAADLADMCQWDCVMRPASEVLGGWCLGR